MDRHRIGFPGRAGADFRVLKSSLWLTMPISRVCDFGKPSQTAEWRQRNCFFILLSSFWRVCFTREAGSSFRDDQSIIATTSASRCVWKKSVARCGVGEDLLEVGVVGLGDDDFELVQRCQPCLDSSHTQPSNELPSSASSSATHPGNELGSSFDTSAPNAFLRLRLISKLSWPLPSFYLHHFGNRMKAAE